MGTDIHGVWQRRSKTALATTKETNLQSWEDIESRYTQNRHYQLFAALANVRNGYGFAGVVTGQPVKAISQPKGLPDDFTVVDESHPLSTVEHMDPRRQEWQRPEDPLEVWMGDHSHSWLTDKEMLAWWAEVSVVIQTGILDRAYYEVWDKVSRPDYYCGGISGPNVVLINDSEVAKDSVPNWTHIRCEWNANLAEELDYFFNEVKRLQDLHGEIRFVFGFDS